MCWLVMNGVVPYNHPDVDFTNRKSILKKHSVKSSTTAAIITAGMRYRKKPGEDMKERFERIRVTATKVALHVCRHQANS